VIRAPSIGATTHLVVPVAGVLASQLHDDFSQPRSDGRTHNAIDILAPRGTPVIAAADGTIRKLFISRAGGITIYQFDRDESRLYYYAHLDRYADGLAEGLFVPQGTVIGYVGATGNANGTNHLHFAVETLPPTKEWWKGTPVNPYPLLTAQ
jgi:murein DD-endopeptidase MepM/ murein hydrolase activator NlpD